MQGTSDLDTLSYNGLTEHTEGLPADAYYDPRQYERELQRIWYRNWVYVGRSSDVERHRAFRTFELGDQKILLVRDDQGQLQGFHNTCRHRGAALCRESEGMLRAGTIICPYHAWVYNLQGDLLRTSSKTHASGFDVADYPLYKISVREWNGFIFVALTDSPPPFEKIFDLPLNRLDAWPLEDLIVGHVLQKTIESNWKIFWENYNECLHCPGVHPQLSQLVPIYGRGLLEERDDPQWRAHAADRDPKFKGGLRGGAATWSLDGRITGVPFHRTVGCGPRGRPYLHDQPAIGISRRACRLCPRGAPAAPGSGTHRHARRILVFSADPGRSGVRYAQCRGFHQHRHDRRCTGVRTQPTGSARGSACARRGHARGVCHPTIP